MNPNFSYHDQPEAARLKSATRWFRGIRSASPWLTEIVIAKSTGKPHLHIHTDAGIASVTFKKDQGFLLHYPYGETCKKNAYVRQPEEVIRWIGAQIGEARP